MVLVCALVLNLKQSALERDNADVAPTYEQAMAFLLSNLRIIRISVLYCTAVIEAEAHS